MNMRQILSTSMRLVVAGVCVLTAAGCGNETLLTGRGAHILVISRIEAASGSAPGEFVANLQSDVQVLIRTTVNGTDIVTPTIFNDLVRLSLNLVAKNQGGLLPGGVTPTASPINTVTINRYRVTFRRTDGRNTPGVDVPFGFDGAVTATVDLGEDPSTVVFDVVRHQAKLDPPLRNLVGFKGLGFISTIAEITVWGRDLNGNEVSATGSIDVQFSDFGDEES
jgi:hypothetical protein